MVGVPVLYSDKFSIEVNGSRGCGRAGQTGIIVLAGIPQIEWGMFLGRSRSCYISLGLNQFRPLWVRHEGRQFNLT